jgi:predicted glycoside hydrolase/deacetylase ChbG (UPF0249 family)
MLIINADDWGRSKAETDAALACARAGTVTSVSAMVFMKDSERAAKVGLEQRLQIGLHLNFSERFTGKVPSPQIAKTQSGLVDRLRRTKYSHLLYYPGLRQQVAEAYRAQVDEFERLYGCPPAHIDGHHHLHLSSNVVFGNVIPEGVKVRRNFSFQAGEKSLINRTYRRFVDRWLSRRHPLPDYFFCLNTSITMGRLDRIAELAHVAVVEVMTHPIVELELRFLLGPDFEARFQGIPLAGHQNLS